MFLIVLLNFALFFCFVNLLQKIINKKSHLFFSEAKVIVYV